MQHIDSQDHLSLRSPCIFIHPFHQVEAAAFCSIGSLAVPNLLEKGAHEIPIKESYPKGVKQLLQDSYEHHKKKLAERLT